MALLRRGQFSAAADLFRQVLQATPRDALANAGLGHCLIRLGQEQDAWLRLDAACRLSDRIPQAFSDLAWLAFKRGDMALAQQSAERASVLNPADAQSHFILGQVLFRQAQFAAAEHAFAQAARLHMEYIDARFTLGNQAYDGADFAAASRHYGAYAQLRPEDPQGWINHGLSLLRAGDWSAARRSLEKAVALAPTQVKPLALLASALTQGQASHAEVIGVVERVLALAPNSVEMHVQMASSLFGEYRYAEAKQSLRRALALDPHNLTARWLDFQIPDHVVAPDEAAREAYLERWQSGIAQFAALDWEDPKIRAQAAEAVTSTTNFYLAYLGKPLLAEYQQNALLLRKLTLLANPQCVEAGPRVIGRKRRKVAVVSSSLNAHSVSLVWSSTLLALDSEQFELAAFYLGTDEDASTARWRARVARFDSGNHSVAAWIERLRAFAPDIVIFTDIGMNRLVQALASVRHAPVQITTWGHPVTSGMSTIDYFLGAAACEPDDAESHYSEKLIRLPRLGCYLDLPEPVPLVDKTERTDRPFRFLCAQSTDKLHPAHDALFARILKANPHAELDILCSMPSNVADALDTRMRRAFTQLGVDGERRCRIHPRLPVADYYRFLSKADACLDSLDFSGGITSLDALRRNLPIVTLPGRLMRGRQTFGMLKLLDLDELIAVDTNDYIDIATRLAQEPPWHHAIAQRIHARKNELYRDAGVVTALAQFLGSVESPVQ